MSVPIPINVYLFRTLKMHVRMAMFKEKVEIKKEAKLNLKTKSNHLVIEFRMRYRISPFSRRIDQLINVL